MYSFEGMCQNTYQDIHPFCNMFYVIEEAIPSPPLDPTDELYLSCSWTKRHNINKTSAPVKYENYNKH
jgi:hypothetical protein